MTHLTLEDLQASVQDRTAFGKLEDYHTLCHAFLTIIQDTRPTRIVSPTEPNYIFYQFGPKYGHKITRPLNTDLFFETAEEFSAAFGRFEDFLSDLKRFKNGVSEQPAKQKYLESNEISRVVYTIQQSTGCIGDSLANPNQSRKRIGQLFETMVKLVIQKLGLVCESRTLKIPVPHHPGYIMSYELDLVFSRKKVIITSETKFLHPSEVVGSVKTTSKDRLDKIFLDKYMLTRLLGREIPVIAIFLHDVQRARRGSSIFGISTTFKSNHFLGYTVALNELDGVYYVDPRPVMKEDERLSEHIGNFQDFLVSDLWRLSDS